MRFFKLIFRVLIIFLTSVVLFNLDSIIINLVNEPGVKESSWKKLVFSSFSNDFINVSSFFFQFLFIPLLLGSLLLYFFRSIEGKIFYWLFSLVPFGFLLLIGHYSFILGQKTVFFLLPLILIVILFIFIWINYRGIIKNQNYPEIDFRKKIKEFKDDLFLRRMIFKLIKMCLIFSSLLCLIDFSVVLFMRDFNFNTVVNQIFNVDFFYRFVLYFTLLFLPTGIYILFERGSNAKLLHWFLAILLIVLYYSSSLNLYPSEFRAIEFTPTFYVTLLILFLAIYHNFKMVNREAARNMIQ